MLKEFKLTRLAFPNGKFTILLNYILLKGFIFTFVVF